MKKYIPIDLWIILLVFQLSQFFLQNVICQLVFQVFDWKTELHIAYYVEDWTKEKQTRKHKERLQIKIQSKCSLCFGQRGTADIGDCQIFPAAIER